VLLLDEPTSGVGASGVETFQALLRALPRELSILIVEHDMDLVMEVSDRIVVLNFGEKVAEGPPKEIRKNERVIDVYLGNG
jgi:branched-chain amino acid transport system ATP-binding protein